MERAMSIKLTDEEEQAIKNAPNPEAGAKLRAILEKRAEEAERVPSKPPDADEKLDPIEQAFDTIESARIVMHDWMSDMDLLEEFRTKHGGHGDLVTQALELAKEEAFEAVECYVDAVQEMRRLINDGMLGATRASDKPAPKPKSN